MFPLNILKTLFCQKSLTPWDSSNRFLNQQLKISTALPSCKLILKPSVPLSPSKQSRVIEQTTQSTVTVHRPLLRHFKGELVCQFQQPSLPGVSISTLSQRRIFLSSSIAVTFSFSSLYYFRNAFIKRIICNATWKSSNFSRHIAL